MEAIANTPSVERATFSDAARNMSTEFPPVEAALTCHQWLEAFAIGRRPQRDRATI